MFIEEENHSLANGKYKNGKLANKEEKIKMGNRKSFISVSRLPVAKKKGADCHLAIGPPLAYLRQASLTDADIVSRILVGDRAPGGAWRRLQGRGAFED